MPKRRQPQATLSTVDNQTLESRIEAFANEADNESVEQQPDPTAKRDFKEIRLPLNEYEFRELDRKAKLTNRSRLNFIRQAILQFDT